MRSDSTIVRDLVRPDTRPDQIARIEARIATLVAEGWTDCGEIAPREGVPNTWRTVFYPNFDDLGGSSCVLFGKFAVEKVSSHPLQPCISMIWPTTSEETSLADNHEFRIRKVRMG